MIIICVYEDIFFFSHLKDYLVWWFSEVPQIFFSGCHGGKGEEELEMGSGDNPGSTFQPQSLCLYFFCIFSFCIILF